MTNPLPLDFSTLPYSRHTMHPDTIQAIRDVWSEQLAVELSNEERQALDELRQTEEILARTEAWPFCRAGG